MPGFKRKRRYNPSSRSQGGIRREQEAPGIAAGIAAAKARGNTNIHVERDSNAPFAGTGPGVYSRPRRPTGGQGSSRSQGSRLRKNPSEGEIGFDPRTMGNRRWGRGATAPSSRMNPEKRKPLEVMYMNSKTGMPNISAAATRRLTKKQKDTGNYARRGRF